MKPPKGQPPSRRGRPDAHFYVTGDPQGRCDKPILLTHATLQDLSSYFAEIRAAYWEGVVNGGYKDPFVFVIHRMSRYAKVNGLDGRPDPLIFHSCTREGAVKMGLLPHPDPPEYEPPRPPIYEVLLATGEEIERHLVLNLRPSGVLDKIHSDPSSRPQIEADHPDIADLLRERPELVEKPWLLNDGLGFRVNN